MPNIDLSKIDLKSLACIIFNVLKNHHIDAVLVGGACVTIYTEMTSRFGFWQRESSHG